ncbi:MAG: hypothetical protein AAF617_09390 [Bacteroidota bacterium]
MKKQKEIKKLNLSKSIIGNLMQLSGGRPPKTWRYCETDVCEPSDDGGGYSALCSRKC